VRAENRNTAWSSAFVDELARAGVRHACVAPGSRSTPLVLALAAEERIRCHVHLDERSAAFFALGLGKATGMPAAVVTTSGTAAANLLPAVMEADASRAPLLLLTADRPARLRGTDANQTVDQLLLFGGRVRLFHEVAAPEAADRPLRYVRALAGRAVGAALGPPAGPVHLDFPFEKPLEPTPVEGDVPADLAARAPLAAEGRPGGRPYTGVASPRLLPDPAEVADLAVRLGRAGRALIVCGPSPDVPGALRLGRAALRLAGAGGWPLLADPLSGARFAPGAASGALGAYDLFLRSARVREALRPDFVLRLGPAPTSARLSDYLEEHADREQVVADTGPSWADHAASASELVRAEPAALAGRLAEVLEGMEGRETPGGPDVGDAPAWSAAWRAAEEAAATAAAAAVRGREGVFEGEVLSALALDLPAGARLFVGSSMPVRDLDAFGRPRDEPLSVIGNRGASGIDGSVSTALGMAAAGAAAAPLTGAARGAGGEATVAVLGDLALYHDMNGLLAAGREGLDVVLVVIHNDGGGIFHMLPIREHEPAFTPYFATPHGLDFAHAARLYGLAYRCIETRRAGEVAGMLQEAVGEALQAGGAHLLVVRSERGRNHALHERAAAAASDAAEAALAERGLAVGDRGA
jgi:2-succinyl-5-enolpyruvyl-6-hydroxy-3-cyclohexene-1-carboxylate synthase